MESISQRQFEIIEAAGRILTRAGTSGLTIKNLAKEMKFSESAIYRHFTSKEEIIIALLEYLALEMDTRHTSLLASEQTPLDKFTRLFRNQFEFFKEHPHFVVAVFSDGLMEESSRINDTILKIMGVKMKHLRPIIIQGQSEQVFTDAVSAEDLIHIVMGTFRLQMYKWRVSNFQFDILQQGNKMIHSVLTLIKSDKR